VRTCLDGQLAPTRSSDVVNLKERSGVLAMPISL